MARPGYLFEGLAIAACTAIAAAAAAQSVGDRGSGGPGSGGIDCTQVKVEYSGDSRLTREERIARMDRSLDRSLSRFDACRLAGGAGGGSAGGGSGGGDPGTGAGGSVASSDLSGPDGAAGPQGGERGDAAEASATAASRTDARDPEAPQGARKLTSPAADNGKVPDDIPPADNDSVLESQIRQAAMNETDPELRKKLWNEYRKYRGLPQE